MRIVIDQSGKCIGYGDNNQWLNLANSYPAPAWINAGNFNRWTCSDVNDINLQSSWTEGPEPVSNDPVTKQQADIYFGNSLIAEFNAGEQQTAVDAQTYQVIIEVFKYVLFALQMGNLLQAKNQLNAISTTAYVPVWDATKRDYFLNKINQYLAQ